MWADCFDPVPVNEDTDGLRLSLELLRMGEGENWVALTGLV